MKLMPCPLNGLRNIQEFACAGEVQFMPDNDAPSEIWADYVFMKDNPAGVVREWWIHVPTSFWFIAERDTRTDDILKTYTADVVFGQGGAQ